MNNTSNTTRVIHIMTSRCAILITACLLIIMGYWLMAGSGSTEQSFCADKFSPRRIVYAPILCLSGYLLIVVGIVRRK